MTGDGRQAVQQIFSNLASNIAVSEVYIVPADLDPDRRDPKTGAKQVPILMVDKVRLGLETSEPEDATDPDAPAQEEIYEYRALRTLMGSLLTIAPHLPAKGADIPLLSIGSLITCDNSAFNTTHQDADRTGPIYSVPFYDENDRLKGTISAIMLKSVVARLLPDQNYALVDTSSHDIFNAPQEGQHVASAPHVAALEPDPSSFYSEALGIKTKDPHNTFMLWSGRPRAKFLTSDELGQVNRFRLLGNVCAGAIALSAWVPSRSWLELLLAASPA